MKHKILNGNELLIQGAFEAGFHLYTGYPGSPLADFFNILHQQSSQLQKKGIKVVLANSEAHAAAMASGAKMAGKNVLVAMKSMGLHVASDALSVGNFANPGDEEKSGVVIAVGDDPWSMSTSTPADSRFLFKHLHIPFLEPSSPQELKDWMAKALEISQKSSVYCGILLTTFMAEGGGRVRVFDEKDLTSQAVTLDPNSFNLSKNVMVPPNSLFADKEMIESRFPLVKKTLKELSLDKVFGNEDSPIAIITSGGVFETLKQVLEDYKLMEWVSLYKAATSYPLNESQMIPFLRNKKSLIVVEEKRSFLEVELRSLINSQGFSIQVLGKHFEQKEGFQGWGGLTYEVISQKMMEALKILGMKDENLYQCLEKRKQNAALELQVPARLPTFCPGCPHRETLSVMKEIREVLMDKDINLISHGDVGCYSLSFLEPFKEMHDLSAMGQGGALGAGADLFATNPSVVLMGDSTFFHSGMTAISNSVQMGHNITYILLDNDNTAMTGHQVTPRSGLSVDKASRPRQSMLEVAQSLKVNEAIEVNPSDRYFYKNLLLEYVQKKGVKVIVSNKECGLTFHGRKKREDRKTFSSGSTVSVRNFYQINTFACEDCRACVEMTGCPGLSQTHDAYGTKVMIDPQICVADSYCTKIKACPSFELVEVHDYHPSKYKKKNEAHTSLGKKLSPPVVKKSFAEIENGSDLRTVVIGVGGSGVTTISRIIAEASRSMSDQLHFKFMDQKGLAQRNGSVISHMAIYSYHKTHGPVTPLGSADLVLSPDLIEGARAISYLSPTGRLIVDDDFQIPLSLLLDDGVEKDPVSQEDIKKDLLKKLGDRVCIVPLKKMSFDRFGRPVYASAMILGVAYQLGYLPFSEDDLRDAFKGGVPKVELEANWEAFNMGRQWVYDNSSSVQSLSLDKDLDKDLSQKDLEQDILWEKSVGSCALPWQNSERFIGLWKSQVSVLKKEFPTLSETFLKQYVHDIVIFDQGKSITSFVQDALLLKKLYSEDLLNIAIRVLAKTYWIKDEVFVSHLMTSPLKSHQDDMNFKDLGTSFKIRYINRPSFDLWGHKIEFDFSPHKWMLKMMRHLRVLRLILPQWHQKEREIALQIRKEILSNSLSLKRLKELDHVKGYREVRFKKAAKFLSQS